jgi:hypothetical protein
MTSNHDRLTSLISTGEVDLIHVESVPRSISTALARALSESETPSIYINEPFNRMRHDIEDASTRILDAVEQHGRPADSPLTIVSKNMARNISQPIFDELVEISKGIVWSVRDPRIQISSLLTRIANDLAYEPGADMFPMEELTDDQIRSASDFLENGPKSTNFSKTSWEDIGYHYASLGKSATSVVIDGSALTRNPVGTLASAARTLGLAYSARMTNGWEGEFINANTGYNPNLTDETHAWTKDAVTSSGIVPSSDQMIDISRLPAYLQTHLNDVAIPTYRQMVEARD